MAGESERPEEDRFEFSVATAPPTARHRQLALAVGVATLAAYAAIIPGAATPLPRVDSFIPAVVALIFVTDLVTAVLLFGQYSSTGSRALLALASGYLYSSLIIVSRGVLDPVALAPAIPEGEPQAYIWLDNFWRLGLSLALLVYAVLASRTPPKDASTRSSPAAILWSVASIVLVVATLTWAAIAGDGLWPPLFLDGESSPLNHAINAMIALASLSTLLLLWTRGTSVLDVWITVAAFAMLAESAVLAFLLSPPYSLAFYGMRVIALLVSKVVLIELLWKTMKLHTSLASSIRELRRERANRLINAGTLMAAISHDVRQPMAAINLLASAGRQSVERAPPDVGTVSKGFGEIKDAAGRANDVFDNILRLVKDARQSPQIVDINGLTLEAIRLLQKDLDARNVTVVTELTPDSPLIEGHAGQLREVILNLIQNAVDAMASTTDRPRVLTIATLRLGAGAISISLEDTGPGIDPAVLPSIFDPFVTTKESGMGLGLAICKMVVDQHGGELSAASGGDGGARFRITLPTRAEERAASPIGQEVNIQKTR